MKILQAVRLFHCVFQKIDHISFLLIEIYRHCKQSITVGGGVHLMNSLFSHKCEVSVRKIDSTRVFSKIN